MPLERSPSWPVFRDGGALYASQLQQLVRNLELLSDAPLRQDGYASGLIELKLRSDLEAGRLSLDSCEAILPDGTWVRIPEHDTCEELSGIAQKLRPGDTGQVYLTLAKRTQPLTTIGTGARGRFTEIRVGVKDDFEPNRDPDEIEVLRRNLSLLVLRNDEQPGPSLSCIKLAELRMESTLQMQTAYVPPCVCMRPILNSPTLDECRRLLSHLLSNISLNADTLREELRKYETSSVIDANSQRQYLRLQALAAQRWVIEHLFRSQGTHPAQLYLELARLTEALRAVSTEQVDPTPVYAHDALFTTFSQLSKCLTALLARKIQDDFDPGELTVSELDTGILYKFAFKQPLLLSQGQLYLAFAPGIEANDILRAFQQGGIIKVAGGGKAKDFWSAGRTGLVNDGFVVPDSELPKRKWVSERLVHLRCYGGHNLPVRLREKLPANATTFFEEAWRAVQDTHIVEVFVKKGTALRPQYLVNDLSKVLGSRGI